MNILTCISDYSISVYCIGSYIYKCSVSHFHFCATHQKRSKRAVVKCNKTVYKSYFHFSLIALSRFAIWWNQRLFTVNSAYNSCLEWWVLRITHTLTVFLSLTRNVDKRSTVDDHVMPAADFLQLLICWNLAVRLFWRPNKRAAQWSWMKAKRSSSPSVRLAHWFLPTW